MAVYNMPIQTGESVNEIKQYLNKMNRELQHVLSNLDDENMTGEYADKIASIRNAARSASAEVAAASKYAIAVKEIAEDAERTLEEIRKIQSEMQAALEGKSLPMINTATFDETEGRYQLREWDMVLEAGQLVSIRLIDVLPEGMINPVAYPIHTEETPMIKREGDLTGAELTAGWHLFLYAESSLIFII